LFTKYAEDALRASVDEEISRSDLAAVNIRPGSQPSTGGLPDAHSFQ
jgi:hypothetical protein